MMGQHAHIHQLSTIRPRCNGYARFCFGKIVDVLVAALSGVEVTSFRAVLRDWSFNDHFVFLSTKLALPDEVRLHGHGVFSHAAGAGEVDFLNGG